MRLTQHVSQEELEISRVQDRSNLQRLEGPVVGERGVHLQSEGKVVARQEQEEVKFQWDVRGTALCFPKRLEMAGVCVRRE